jgi:hypothetical protein
MLKSLLISSVALLAFSSTAFAAVKTYQVTGPVLAISESSIIVQKGSEKWEIQKAQADVPADVKVGSKVTIEYSMSAVTVTDKTAKKAEKPAGKPAATK